MCKFLVAAALLTAVSLAVPAYADGNGAVVGTLLGAGAGGLIGNQFGHGAGREATTVAGVIGGGLIGNSLGTSYDNTNRYAGSGSSNSALFDWPDYDHVSYVPNYVAPPAPPPELVAYYSDDVQTYCREFTQEIRVNGQPQESYGTACLQPDGTWRVVQ